jgi:hypothetical protein
MGVLPGGSRRSPRPGDRALARAVRVGNMGYNEPFPTKDIYEQSDQVDA